MTKKRLLVVAALLVGLLGVGLGVAAFLPDPPGVTKGNFGRIKKGMSQAEVEGILCSQRSGRIQMTSGGEIRDFIRWHGVDGAAIIVAFDGEIVTGAQWQGSQETILEKICRWLHLG